MKKPTERSDSEILSCRDSQNTTVNHDGRSSLCSSMDGALPNDFRTFFRDGSGAARGAHGEGAPPLSSPSPLPAVKVWLAMT